MTGPGRPPIGPVREVRIPDELWAGLTEIADRDGIALAELIRRVLEEWMETP